MGQNLNPDSWIPLEDYLIKGVRAQPMEGRRAHGSSSQQPELLEDWIPIHDYMVKGVRRRAEARHDTSYVISIRDPPTRVQPPPEAGVTIFDAVAEIHAVPGSKSVVFSRLQELRAQDQREFAAGLITRVELDRRALATAIIRENHARRMETVTQWYLENYFRFFENPQAVDEPG